MSSNSDRLSLLIRSLPEDPGVYQYIDSEGTIIYVGKAKSIRKRVSSYFNKALVDRKTSVLVSRIHDIRYLVVDSELDALLLENNLIKEHQPRYNILLRDDKSFPWICIKNEPFPRVFPTRQVVQDGSEYYGPYASVRMMHTLLSLIRQLYPIRSCSFALTPENIQKGKFKRCLDFHIGNCLGGCEGLQSEEDYTLIIDQVRKIIKGNIGEVISHLRHNMQQAVAELKFEKAQEFKEKLEILSRYQSKSTIVNPMVSNADVFSIEDDNHTAFVNYLRVMNGAVVQGITLEMKRKLDEDASEMLAMAIIELRQRYKSDATEIIVPIDPGYAIPGVTLTIPQRGDKKKLLDVSFQNAKQYRMDQLKQEKIKDPEAHTTRILEQMKKDLRLSELPRHIECFDNSNIQGTTPVAACVVFKDIKPSKRDYRHFNIKTVEGPDDFASMEEVVHRRYRRLMEEDQSLPQLIVIDGGKGQLNAALKSLNRLGLEGKIGIVSIAKRLEEIYYPNDPYPLYLDKRSETLKVLQHLRNEAHRFGITHHRSKRNKNTLRSELEDIQGIGPASVQELLRTFKSTRRVREASEEELEKVLGRAKAKLVIEYFSAK